MKALLSTQQLGLSYSSIKADCNLNLDEIIALLPTIAVKIADNYPSDNSLPFLSNRQVDLLVLILVQSHNNDGLFSLHEKDLGESYKIHYLQDVQTFTSELDYLRSLNIISLSDQYVNLVNIFALDNFDISDLGLNFDAPENFNFFIHDDATLSSDESYPTSSPSLTATTVDTLVSPQLSAIADVTSPTVYNLRKRGKINYAEIADENFDSEEENKLVNKRKVSTKVKIISEHDKESPVEKMKSKGSVIAANYRKRKRMQETAVHTLIMQLREENEKLRLEIKQLKERSREVNRYHLFSPNLPSSSLDGIVPTTPLTSSGKYYLSFYPPSAGSQVLTNDIHSVTAEGDLRPKF